MIQTCFLRIRLLRVTRVSEMPASRGMYCDREEVIHLLAQFYRDSRQSKGFFRGRITFFIKKKNISLLCNSPFIFIHKRCLWLVGCGTDPFKLKTGVGHEIEIKQRKIRLRGKLFFQLFPLSRECSVHLSAPLDTIISGTTKCQWHDLWKLRILFRSTWVFNDLLSTFPGILIN